MLYVTVGKKQSLDVLQRPDIVTLYQEGYPKLQISAKLQISKTAVQKFKIACELSDRKR